MAKKKVKERIKDLRKLSKKDEKDEAKIFAFLAVLLSIIGFVIALLAKKDDEYVMFYAKQSLVLFFLAIIVWGINTILMIIPIIGKIAAGVLTVIVLVLWIVALVYSFSGKEKETPFIGHYARKINL